ncbi:uncharacterized protein C21orf58 homolog isoform X2 [Apus apus]|uniref:uncharacterized protein C21orf58 homolog isoform X2 n=1 Tax=Apus apus TaxID=8895 RepID=UPI0021F91102|nr:uncharacterized protein C21orf58 homolog isoform X2 [Apus apus]
MTDPSVVDHLTRLQLKLLEKRLENEQENLEKMESPLPAARNRREDVLQSALRRRRDLLQQLREQHLLEELSQSPAPAGGHCHSHRAAPPHVYQIPFPGPQAEPPRIIQQTMPSQPATIIQQLPQPPPLITQIPPAQPFAASRSGSIKEGPAVCCSPGCESRQAQAICSAPPPPLPSHRSAPSAPGGLPSHIHGTSLEWQHTPCPAYVANILTVHVPLQVDCGIAGVNLYLNSS